MSQSRRILIVDDSRDDTELAVRTLRRSGCDLTYRQVDTPETMQAALEEEKWDVVIADYSMPRFNGLAALKIVRDTGLDMPFILVSGTVGEELAVEAMRRGVDDYVLKSNLARLPHAVERELRDREVRADRNRAEARYHDLVDRVPVGLFRTLPGGSIAECNPALIEMLGYKDADSLKRANITDLWVQPDELARIRAILANEGIVQNFEAQIRRPDASVIWCEQSARAICDASGKVDHYEGVLVDITSRKHAEQETNRARDRVRDLALETARLRSEFLASMSHEIRTPLVGIIGTGELLSRSDLIPEQRRLTEIIRSSGELLLTVVNDILDFSKLAAGKVELEKLDFDLVEMTETLIDSFAATARAKGIELALYVDLNMPTGLRGDQGRLRQILNNLVANAIKFTDHGDVTIRATRAEDAAGDVLVRFEIIDTGIGIPPDVQQRLFQPFVQAEGSTSRRFGGTGLGLVIASKLVEQMGGEIGFESEPGKGSNFHFTARIEKGSEIVRPWMAPTVVSCFNGMRAIVVNDSPASRQVISQYLSSWGIEHAAVSSGAVALAMLRRQPEAGDGHIVALIDEQNADMGSLRLARAIKDHCGKEHSKVIMFSAEGGVRSTTDDVDAWITKPVRPSHLFSCLLELCGKTDRVRTDKVAAAPPRPIGNNNPDWRKAVRVLLVDDNLVNRTIGAKQLSALGYAGKIADGARQGLQVVSSGGCDIVLMDCEMPGMDGYEAVAEIRRREGDARHTVVIALTAHATADDRVRCLDAGMDDYLSKPVKLDALAEMLGCATSPVTLPVRSARCRGDFREIVDRCGGRSGGWRVEVAVMPLESSIVGSSGAPMVSEIDSRWTMAYAAALGDAIPCYMDTVSGVIAHPMFPVCFEWPVQVAMRAQFERSTSLRRDEAMRGVHATHDTVLHRAIRPPERLTTQLTVAGVERRKPGAYMVTRLDTVDEAGKPVCTSWYGAIYRGVEVKGPDAPAKLAPAPMQPIVEEGEPLMECQIDVPAGMAHIYTECARIFNPIHTDASVARAAGLPEIILHGTATLAMTVSRIVESEAGKDPARVERVAARFGAMVTMPSTLTVRVLAREGAAVFFETLSGEGRLAIRDGIVIRRA